MACVAGLRWLRRQAGSAPLMYPAVTRLRQLGRCGRVDHREVVVPSSRCTSRSKIDGISRFACLRTASGTAVVLSGGLEVGPGSRTATGLLEGRPTRPHQPE